MRSSHPFDLKSHVWLFEGAEGGKWLQNLRDELGIIDNGDGSSSCGKVDDDGDERETKKQRVL